MTDTEFKFWVVEYLSVVIDLGNQKLVCEGDYPVTLSLLLIVVWYILALLALIDTSI